MKLYKKWKGMSKKAKISLVGTALYATTSLALPAYAAVKQDSVLEVGPINLEQVLNVEQAELLFKEKINEYSEDKLLNNQELQNLYWIEKHKINLMQDKKAKIEEEYKNNTEVATQHLEEKIKNYQTELGDTLNISVFADLRNKLDKEILTFYSALINTEKGNVAYNADTLIESKLNAPLKEVIKGVDNVLKQYYNMDIMGMLLGKEKYTINDVLTVYNIMKDRAENYYKSDKEELKDKIKSVKEDMGRIVNSDANKAIKDRINGLEDNISVENYLLDKFCNYFAGKEDVKKFEEKYGNYNNHFSMGMIKTEILSNKGLETTKEWDPLDALYIAEKNFESDNKKLISTLETRLSKLAPDVKVEELGNPAKMKIPMWLGLVLGFVIPVARNLLIKSYVDGKDKSNIPYGFSAIAGFTNGTLGFLFDGLHPLIYPARLFATPLIIQPAKKIFLPKKKK
ncbi:MAG: hypothetical protein L6408_06870 [Nanoarchaeota archaeon]|nr:hypothetical protein [Nanoarchaeota archaeon]